MALIDNYMASKEARIYKDDDYDGLMANLKDVQTEVHSNKLMEEQFKTLSDNINVDYSRPKSIKRKPIYDWDTKNKSFLNLYNDLYNLGIKNNKFFLRLYDRDLIGINPYQPNLPIEMQLKIDIECKINPYYFLREVCRIPADGLPIEIGGGTQYKIDRNNVAAWYLLLNGIDVYRSKPRQCGKTQDSLAFMNYAYHFGTQSSDILNFNKKAPDAQMNLGRLKVQRDMLPIYMQMRLGLDDEGKILKEVDNVKTMWNPITKNKIYCMASATGKDSANQLGRGFTSPIQFFDEFDFTPYNTTILTSAGPAYVTAHENAIKNGALSARIFSSTPGDLDSRDGAAASEMVSRMLPWKDEYLDMDINKLKSIIDNKLLYNGIVFIEHDWKQLKKTMDWYELQCRALNYDQTAIAREIELKRIRGNSNSPFSQKDLYFLEHNMKEPVAEVDYTNTLTPFYMYEVLDKRYPYILSVDPAEGLSQDNNAITLINPYTQTVAAEFQSRYINQTELSKIIVKFMNDYCPKAMIVIENNRGRELIHRLLDTKYRNRVWYDKDKLDRKFSERVNEYGATVYKNTLDQSYGFNTNTASRNTLMAILESQVQENKRNIISKFVINDILGLERTPSGKIEASKSANAHDDNVMSWLIGLCVYFHATNLEEFGIIRGQAEPAKFDPNDPVYIKQKVMELIEKLPEGIRSQFSQYEDKNEVTDSWKYAKQLQEEELKYKLANPQFMSNDEYNDYKNDEDAIFNNMQRNLLESDYYFNDHRNDINIDDLI